MTSVTFKAWQGDRYVSLWDIVTALRELVEDLRWRVRIDELAPGPESSRLEAVGADAWLDTVTLLGVANRDVQVIDGQVSGYRERTATAPRLTIRAVDSTWWDVETEDDEIVETVLRRFPNAEIVPRA